MPIDFKDGYVVQNVKVLKKIYLVTYYIVYAIEDNKIIIRSKYILYIQHRAKSRKYVTPPLKMLSVKSSIYKKNKIDILLNSFKAEDVKLHDIQCTCFKLPTKIKEVKL